ncbi:hypothetical protein D1AOALGA4SA_5451 [Olavius algarvensis Delta 1 endosymbiont]|nr:hypothetical protein D1AOALGA4SA_5451 [Olavius algarvensis Delta 1 endosymbiont]
MPLLTKLIFPVLILISLYIQLHLMEADKKIEGSPELSKNIDVPWIGLYEGAENKYALLLQLILAPIMLMFLIAYSA